MTTHLVPADVQLAARRGFVRTTYQAYAATLSTGLPSAAAIVAFVQDDSPAKWIVAGITVALALVSPPLAGLKSYLDITSKGIPEDYLAAPAATELGPVAYAEDGTPLYTEDRIRLDDMVWQALDSEHQAGRLPDDVDQLALAAKISDAIAAGPVDLTPGLRGPEPEVHDAGPAS